MSRPLSVRIVRLQVGVTPVKYVNAEVVFDYDGAELTLLLPIYDRQSRAVDKDVEEVENWLRQAADAVAKYRKIQQRK